ncbi:unnamed protein product [Adineta ricciae]|uniref:Uncharacterized protein n=1 Tax=Adineta ricciae TaxID=249248 RepID=A0A815A0G7_ADIRI|nr:unnamed protein product [Adineta ricciae]CAF1255642.1 unnamed protein product [Adineta ricciae]
MTQANMNSKLDNEQALDDGTTFYDMNWRDHVFDIPDYLDQNATDNDDGHQETIFDEYLIDFDFDYVHTNVDQEEMIVTVETKRTHDKQTADDCILSHRLSQLSTNVELDNDDIATSQKKRPMDTPPTPTVVSKKIRIVDDLEINANSIPSYLQSTDPLFNTYMHDYMLMNQTASLGIPITVEDLRQLAILKHMIAVLQIRHKLWTVYLKLGTGQLETEESRKTTIDRCLWPVEVKERCVSLTHWNGTDAQQRYEKFTRKFLDELKELSEQYQDKYDVRKSSYSVVFTEELEKAIDKFVYQHGIRSQQMKLDYKIEILTYDYDAQILERKYQQCQPTEYQTQLAKRLYDLYHRYVQSKQELIEFKQRILYNKPNLPESVSMADVSMGQFSKALEEKKQQQDMTDSIVSAILDKEQKCHEYQTRFNDEIHRIPMKSDQNNEGLPGKLIDLIYRNFKTMDKKLKYISDFRRNYYLKNHRDPIDNNSEQWFDKKNVDSFAPTMIIDTTSHQLTIEQIKLLNRGPTYLLPCYIYASSESIKDTIQQQYKLLQHHLSLIFARFNINSTQSMFINKQIKDTYVDMFSSLPPLPIYQRAVYECQLVQSIREQLEKNQLILRRTADRRNVFYLGNRKEFEDKGKHYMFTTNTFEFRETIPPTNLGYAYEYLAKIVRAINSDIEKIFNNKKTYKDLLQKLYIDIDKVYWPYLYFLPDVSEKSEVSVKPCIVTRKSITTRLAQFLEDLLQPAVERHMANTSFENSADFLQQFHQYIEENNGADKRKAQHFYPKTIFVKIQILNYYTMASHSTMLSALKDYFEDHLATRYIENISVDRIIELISVFLKNNYFYYDNNIYRCTRGCPESFKINETLAHMYTIQWQKILRRKLYIDREFYGRYHNQIFFTWNRTTYELDDFFEKFRNQYQNIQMNVNIGSTVHFIDVHLENRQGTLYTRLYHDPDSQAYTLPYVLDNPIVTHSHWLRSALIRAVRCYISVHDFHRERIYLEVTCLTNGYSFEFIHRRVEHFFTYFNAASLYQTVNQQVYDQLRLRLFKFIGEQQRTSRQYEELAQNKRLIRLSYFYAYGPHRKFKQILKKTLSENLRRADHQTREHNELKINIMTQHRYSLNALLSQQKPSHPLLDTARTIFPKIHLSVAKIFFLLVMANHQSTNEQLVNMANEYNHADDDKFGLFGTYEYLSSKTSLPKPNSTGSLVSTISYSSNSPPWVSEPIVPSAHNNNLLPRLAPCWIPLTRIAMVDYYGQESHEKDSKAGKMTSGPPQKKN